jgi:hypothetical protein
VIFSQALWGEMSSRKLWILAAVGDLLVGIASLAVHGFTAAAAGSATRNTARFAILFLLTGFAAAGLRRWFPALTDSANLVRAYMAAQFVHFGFVINLHTVFADRLGIGFAQVAISLLGFSLVAATGLTAGAVTRAGTIIHTVLLYINWLILAADYPQHPVKHMRLVAIPVFFAMIVRWLPKAKAESANAAGA